MTITPEEIARLRALEAKATPSVPPGYFVDRNGTVWSTHPWRGSSLHQIAPAANSHGYLAFKAKTGVGRVRKVLVHRFVCEAFHGPKPSPLHEVRHINGIRADNRAENLAWGTRSENASDRKAHGTEMAAANGRSSAWKLRGRRRVRRDALLAKHKEEA